MHHGAATTNRFPILEGMPESNALFDSAGGRRLQEAIDRLYEAFQAVSLEEPFECCPHCFTEADRIYLERTPVRELTLADAAFILTKSTITLGNERDLNHFLPRILDAWTRGAHYMPELLPESLKIARAAGWASIHVREVSQFARALFGAIDTLEDNVSWYLRSAAGTACAYRRNS